MSKLILERAISLAIKNGWQLPYEDKLVDFEITSADHSDAYVMNPYIRFNLETMALETSLESVIYSHDFAKALWGELEQKRIGKRVVKHKNGWTHHLQQMVIADDPIKYLGENIGSAPTPAQEVGDE